jgi:hypothetical protein
MRPYRAGAELNLYSGEPLMIVYGTHCPDARREVLLNAARALAAYPGGRDEPMPAARFAMKADVDVTAADMQRYNLLLVGGLQENTLTASLLPRLPFTVNAQGELLAGGREPVSLQGALLQMIYYNPLAPRRLIYLFATDADDEEARKLLKEPQNLLVNVWTDAPGDAPDLQVRQIAGPTRRLMQFADGWQWLRLPGTERLVPPAAYSTRANNRALLRAMREASGADIALSWDVPVDKDEKAPAKPYLTYADLAITRAPVATVTGTLSGEDLVAVYQAAISKADMASDPAFTPETLDPQRRYRVVLPLDALWNANSYQRNMHDTAPGPLVSQQAIRAELERMR